ALIRECYGSEAVRQAALGSKAPARRPLAKADDLDGLARALQEARAAEEELARMTVRSLCDEPFSHEAEGKHGEFSLETVTNSQFAGQVVREGERVHYVSLSVRSSWKSTHLWRQAKA